MKCTKINQNKNYYSKQNKVNYYLHNCQKSLTIFLSEERKCTKSMTVDIFNIEKPFTLLSEWLKYLVE